MTVSLQWLLDTYGYLAIFVSAFLEGETLLVMGGFAAQRGYLDLPEIVAVALFGGFLGDQVYFFLGRWRGQQLLARFPTMRQRAAKVDELLYRYHTPLIILIRFMYGFRIVGAVAFGMGRVSAAKFVVFNFIGACLWANLVAGAGFLFGDAMQRLLPDAKRYEWAALAVLALVGVALWTVRRLRHVS